MQHRPSPAYLRSLQTRYPRARKKEKGIILDEFTHTTGCQRNYAMRLLSGHYEYATKPIHRPRARYYTPEDAAALVHLSDLLDGICSKLLVAAIPVVLPQLRQDGSVKISDICAQHLLQVSPSTIDRLLAKRRPKEKRRHGFTKPGSLKHRIPVRTFAERQADEPGFMDCDTVDHSGGNSSGEFAFTLDLVDAYSQWLALRAVRTKAQQLVLDEIQRIRIDLPFRLKGLHSDSGGEFINAHLERYCRLEHLKFTRSRAGKKNDNAWVEQKNLHSVRRLVGYDRYDTQPQVDQLNVIYEVACLYINFFKPVRKLVHKERLGSKVKKIYDDPKTPYQRLIDCKTLNPLFRAELQATYAQLHLAPLKTELDRRLAKLKPSRTFR